MSMNDHWYYRKAKCHASSTSVSCNTKWFSEPIVFHLSVAALFKVSDLAKPRNNP